MEILKGVKEAFPSHVERPGILLNLAHIHVVHSNYESAINLYLKALEMFPAGRGDLETELYLAKAYYKNRQFVECQRVLKRLCVVWPRDMRVKFDLAMCLYEHARMIFDQEVRKVSETKLAKENLLHAKKLMDFFFNRTLDPLQYLPSNASAEL